MDRRSALSSWLADVSEGEAPKERSGGLWRRHGEPPKPLLSMIAARDGEVVEARRSESAASAMARMDSPR